MKNFGNADVKKNLPINIPSVKVRYTTPVAKELAIIDPAITRDPKMRTSPQLIRLMRIPAMKPAK